MKSYVKTRKIVLIVLVFALIVIVLKVAYQRYFRLHHIEYQLLNSEGFATCKVAFVDIDTAKSILIIGDSRAKALGSWRDSIVNVAMGGETTYLLRQKLQFVNKQSINKVVVILGINDIMFGRDAIEIFQNFKVLLKEVIEKFSPDEIYVLSVFGVKLSNSTFVNPKEIELKVQILNNYLQDYCNNKATFANCKFINLNHYFHRNGVLDSKWTSDGVHLNQEGNFILKQKLDSSIFGR